MMMKNDSRALILWVVMLLPCLMSCSEDVENYYSSYTARFTYRYVNTVPQLYSALNSPGIFATIRAEIGKIKFEGETGTSTEVNMTAVNQYQQFYFGIGGFIVGLPNIPELGADIAVPVCFDLACPNCYYDFHLQKKLELESGGVASCANCGRTYNLNNQGVIAEGEPGNSLFRYRMSYFENTLVINN